MKAMGITCGIGSMMIGARQAGFQILGNIEWRPYYHVSDEEGRNTFTENFQKAFMVHKLEELSPVDLKRIRGVDLAMGHPECGNFSNLRPSKRFNDPSDIPLFCDLVSQIHPRFFVQDNLPKALIGFPIDKWHEALPEYDLFPEWVSNYHYGNSQKFRKRFFMIGALKKEKFVFHSGEFNHVKHLRDVIKGLPPRRDIRAINHVHVKDTDQLYGFYPHHWPETEGEERITLGVFKKVIKDYPPKLNFRYRNRFGEWNLKPGYSKIILDNTCPVMTGGGSALDNHYREDTLNPLTQRERARIQGCPDDFIFYPLDYMERGFKTYSAVYKQLGKFMPIEFCRYIADQIAAHIKGKKFKSITNDRLINPNQYIDDAKRWYCQNVGYKPKARRAEICEACWLPCKGENL